MYIIAVSRCQVSINYQRIFFTYDQAVNWQKTVFISSGDESLVGDLIYNQDFNFKESRTISINNDSIIGVKFNKKAFRVSNLLRKNLSVHEIESLPLYDREYLSNFSLANFHNKIAVCTGGLNCELQFESKTYFLEVDKEKWKKQDILPSLNIARYNHSSCVVGDTVYVIAG